MLLTFARSTPVELYIASLLHGLGFGLAMAALATIIVMSVDDDETGAAAGVNNVARTLGGAVGGQLAAVLLVSFGYTSAFAVGLVAMVARDRCRAARWRSPQRARRQPARRPLGRTPSV